MDNTELNKAGDKRGCKDTNEHNFANDPELASIAGKKGNKAKTAISQAITKSPVIASGRNKKITPEIQEIIRDELTAVDKNGVPYMHQFIRGFLKEARSNLNSAPAKMLANAIFKEDFIQQLDIEAAKAINEDIDYKKYLIRTTLYDKQQEVYDNETSKGIIIINSRRSGKTELLGRLIVKGLLRTDAHVAYINRSSAAAIRQIRGPLQTALDKINLKCIKGSVDSQEMHFENGSQLLIIGNNNAADVDKLRGERLSLCLLDEITFQRNAKQLIQETISPALRDYADSQLIMVSTPPRVPHTYVEKLWTDPNVSYKKYHWTFEDNPFIPNRETVIDDVCKEFGVKPEDPFVQREYLGVMGAYDLDALIFRGYQTIDNINLISSTFNFAYIGVDWGFEDKAAVVSTIVKDKQMFVIDSWSESKKSISEICEEVRRQKEALDHLKLAHKCIVICDTNEKGAIQELYNTYKIKDAYCAYKYDKDMAIEQLAEWLRTGTISVLKTKAKHVIEDLDNMLWKRDEETDAILHKVDEDVYHGNAAMALLYISRQFDYDVLGRPNAKTAKSILER